MEKKSIKSHLAPYSIYQKRMTTINHAFASAIAPVDEYDEIKLNKLDKALQALGQEPEGDLHCVYCDVQAETWDHLVGLVKNAELRGYGHQLGNLVPCCRSCNSQKGSKSWKAYLQQKYLNEPSKAESKIRLIDAHLAQYAIQVNLKHAEEQLKDRWMRYRAIKDEIFKLMIEADKIACRLRPAITSKQPEQLSPKPT